jgi:DNA-binding protein HU-beta
MNTADLIERVAAEHGVAKDQARKIIESALAAITAGAASGEEVALAGFGRFKVADRPERQGRNPTTGEPITIVASKKLSSHPPRRCAMRSIKDQQRQPRRRLRIEPR